MEITKPRLLILPSIAIIAMLRYSAPVCGQAQAVQGIVYSALGLSREEYVHTGVQAAVCGVCRLQWTLYRKYTARDIGSVASSTSQELSLKWCGGYSSSSKPEVIVTHKDV